MPASSAATASACWRCATALATSASALSRSAASPCADRSAAHRRSACSSARRAAAAASAEARGGGAVVVSAAAATAAAEDLEAVDVVATSQDDASEVAQERQARVLDAALVLVEFNAGTLLARLLALVTPDAARPWQLLRAFSGRDDERQMRAARAQATLLEGLTEGLERR